MQLSRGVRAIAATGLGLALLLSSCGANPGQAAPDPAASTSPEQAASSPVESPTDTPTELSPGPSEPAPSASASESASESVTEQASKSPEPTEKPSEKPSEKASKKSSEKPSEPGKPAAPGSRTVYLTFDDGPSAYTGRVLDILARYDAKATFFVIGENVGGGSSLVRRARKAGMSIQNHTWNHPDLRTLSTAQIRSQIQRTDNAIRDAGGGRTSCVRPPYGATNAKVRSVLRSMGKRQLLWDVDTLDWERPGADKIYRRVVDDVRNGSVVLAHDGGGTRTQTVAALPRILKTLTKKGYAFGAICD